MEDPIGEQKAREANWRKQIKGPDLLWKTRVLIEQKGLNWTKCNNQVLISDLP